METTLTVMVVQLIVRLKQAIHAKINLLSFDLKFQFLELNVLKAALAEVVALVLKEYLNTFSKFQETYSILPLQTQFNFLK